MPPILAFAGSARVDSFNEKRVRIAASGAKDAGSQRRADALGGSLAGWLTRG